MNKLIILSLSIFIISSSLFAQTKRAISFEDFFSMRRITEFAVSPDGEQVAYSLNIPSIDDNSFKTDIWLIDIKTAEARQFTNAEQSSSGPVWSPDGEYLYITRSQQVWKQAINGGEAVKETEFAPGLSGIILNNAGTKMLFSSQVYPDCETEDCNEQKMQEAENSKVKAQVIDNLMYRHWNSWREGKYSHVLMADMDGSNIRDLTPGAYDTPPISLGGNQDYVFFFHFFGPFTI